MARIICKVCGWNVQEQLSKMNYEIDTPMKEYLNRRIQRKLGRPTATGDYIVLGKGEYVKIDGVETKVSESCLYYFSEDKGWLLVTEEMRVVESRIGRTAHLKHAHGIAPYEGVVKDYFLHPWEVTVTVNNDEEYPVVEEKKFGN